MTTVAFTVPVRAAFDGALARVTDGLQQEGFGVLTTIDVQSIFQEKLGKTFRRYAILGACNPGLAHQAVSADPEAGLLLPCTVIVEETGPGESVVRIADPDAMLQLGHFAQVAAVREVAAEARTRLGRVAARLGEAPATG